MRARLSVGVLSLMALVACQADRDVIPAETTSSTTSSVVDERSPPTTSDVVRATTTSLASTTSTVKDSPGGESIGVEDTVQIVVMDP